MTWVRALALCAQADIITARDTMAAGDEDESSPEDKEFAMCTALMRLGVFLSAVPTSVPMHKDLEVRFTWELHPLLAGASSCVLWVVSARQDDLHRCTGVGG